MSNEARAWLGEPFPFNEAIALESGWKIRGSHAHSPRGVDYKLDRTRTHATRVAP
jgi:hypothetical protein